MSRSILLIGRGPLHSADAPQLGFSQLRTRHFLHALRAAGHDPTVGLLVPEEETQVSDPGIVPIVEEGPGWRAGAYLPLRVDWPPTLQYLQKNCPPRSVAPVPKHRLSSGNALEQPVHPAGAAVRTMSLQQCRVLPLSRSPITG